VSFTVLVGNPKSESRTLGVASAAATAVARQLSLDSGFDLVDLSVLARRLLLPEPSAAIEDAVQQVLDADLLLVVSPTFKGTYSGLLKVFLDRLPYRALAGTTALPLMVMNSPQHALAVEVHLRPVLTELGASVPAAGLALLEADLDQLDGIVQRWSARVADTIARLPVAPEPAMAS